MTAMTFFSVGSGTGPTTVAPARVTVSTILRAELSMTSWSYDLSRMRIFCPAMCDSLSCLASYHPGRWAAPALDALRTLFFCQTPASQHRPHPRTLLARNDRAAIHAIREGILKLMYKLCSATRGLALQDQGSIAMHCLAVNERAVNE